MELNSIGTQSSGGFVLIEIGFHKSPRISHSPPITDCRPVTDNLEELGSLQKTAVGRDFL